MSLTMMQMCYQILINIKEKSPSSNKYYTCLVKTSMIIHLTASMSDKLTFLVPFLLLVINKISSNKNRYTSVDLVVSEKNNYKKSLLCIVVVLRA